MKQIKFNKIHACVGLLIASLSLSTCIEVQAENEGGLAIGAVGIAAIQNPTVRESGSSREVDGKTAFGLGLTIEAGMRSGFALESGLLVLSHKFTRNTANFFGTEVSSTFSSNYVQIPVLIRVRPIPLVNLGGGIYYSRVISSWNVSAQNYAAVKADYRRNEFGMVFALGSNVPIGSSMSLLADLRYTRSLSDSNNTNDDSLKFSTLQFLAGARFGF